MLREVNERPVAMKRGEGAGNADWRIRADAATKSFRIEHHASERWQGIAGFAVSIGACKPPALQAPPVEVAAPDGGASAADPRKRPLPGR